MEGSWMSRRRMLGGVAAAGAGLALPFPRAARGQPPAASGHEGDWTWLVGNWDVWHRRLKARLAGSRDWEVFGGSSVLWLALDGLGTIDDNIVALPAGTYRGLTVRAFDPATGQWAIWWLDGRNPTRIDPPVRGGFDGDSATFTGPDTFGGRPVLVRFRWLDVHGNRPHWEQAMSADGGATWEINWENFFARTAAEPTPLAPLEAHPGDFDFLVGHWDVRHRRLRRRLAASDEWESFAGTLVNRPVLGGHGNVGDNHFVRGGGQAGIGLRAFDPASGDWLSWWLDGRRPTGFAPPLRGRFGDGTGLFAGEDVEDGRPVRIRVTWSRITPRSARWEQAMSADGGVTWETNWVSDFERRA